MTKELVFLPHVTGVIYDSLPELKPDETLPGSSVCPSLPGLGLSFTYSPWANVNGNA